MAQSPNQKGDLRKTNIRNQKVTDVPMSFQKHLKSIEDEDDCKINQRCPGHEWLERRSVAQIDLRDTLDRLGFAESDVGQTNAHPGQDAGRSHQV